MNDRISVEHHYPKNGQRVQFYFMAEDEKRVCRGYFHIVDGSPVFTDSNGNVVDGVIEWLPCNSKLTFSGGKT